MTLRGFLLPLTCIQICFNYGCFHSSVEPRVGGARSEPILALGEVKDATMTGCQSIARLTKTRESYSCSHSPLQLIYKPVHLDEYSLFSFGKIHFVRDLFHRKTKVALNLPRGV